MGAEFSKIAILEMVDIWGGGRDSLSDLNSKGNIRFEGSWSAVEMFWCVGESLGKDDVFDVVSLINFDPIWRLGYAYMEVW